MPQKHKRIDSNQDELVEVFTTFGVSIIKTTGLGNGFPDVVAGGVMPCACGSNRRVRQSRILEIKSLTGVLTPDQVTFRDEWRGQYDIIRTREDVARIIGQKL